MVVDAMALSQQAVAATKGHDVPQVAPGPGTEKSCRVERGKQNTEKYLQYEAQRSAGKHMSLQKNETSWCSFPAS